MDRTQGGQFGDHNTQYNYFGTRQEVRWPVRTGVVPILADAFEPRTSSVDLDALLGHGSRCAVVLSGLGGAGKTQLATAYAERVWSRTEVDLLVWINAATRQGTASGYALAAEAVTGRPSQDVGAAVSRFLAWLSTTDRRWLVVLDDVSEPGDLQHLWPPQTDSGRVVVTTRRRDAGLRTDSRRVVNVGLFAPGEAARYLGKRLGEPAGPDVSRLAETLGLLPLALAQAAAYMLDRGIGCAGYHRRFLDRRLKLADLVPESGALPDDQRHTLATTWSLSTDLADRLHPAGVSRTVLHLAAPLDPNGIPASLFASAPVLDHIRRVRGSGQQIAAADALDALHGLKRLSLAELDPGSADPLVRIHNLVQRATLDTLDENRLADIVTAVADGLLAIWPAGGQRAGSEEVLRANVVHLMRGFGEVLCRTQVHPVLLRAGASLAATGLHSAALEYWRQLREITRNRLSADSAEILEIRHRCGHLLGETGNHQGAIAELSDVLAGRRRVLGDDHDATFVTRASLAWWTGMAGDARAAVAQFQRILADRAGAPGVGSQPGTRYSLAHWLGIAGDPAGAVAILADVVSELMRSDGLDRRETLIAKIVLARMRGKAGDPRGALAGLLEIYPDALRVLGPEHPDTLLVRRGIAHWRGVAEDPARAAADMRRVLPDFIRVFGPDHPHTLSARYSLAKWTGAAGHLDDALRDLDDVLADSVRVRGADHPETRAVRRRIRRWRDEGGATSR